MKFALAILFLFGMFSGPMMADPYPSGFSKQSFNGSVKPATLGGVTTFRIIDQQCSNVDYGDGRGENDCHNGNVRSNLVHRPKARMGFTYEYRFDLWIDPSVSYPGYYNDHSAGFLPRAIDSRLRIASWEGEFLHNFLFMLKADTQMGVTFLDKQCQAPQHFGEWVSFAMRVHWSDDESGWMEVSCDGKEIYQVRGLATNQNPHCYITNQCESDKKKNPKTVLFVLGPVMAGFGFEWKKYGKSSQFTQIQKEGITIKVKNISVKKFRK